MPELEKPLVWSLLDRGGNRWWACMRPGVYGSEVWLRWEDAVEDALRYWAQKD